MDKSKFLKTITLTLFFLIASLSANSQIQRQILGYRLGVSQRSVVVKGLKNKGYDLDIKKDAANKGPIFYTVEGGVSFGGFIWDDVVIGFINGKFYSIMMDTYLTDAQCKNHFIPNIKDIVQNILNHPKMYMIITMVEQIVCYIIGVVMSH